MSLGDDAAVMTIPVVAEVPPPAARTVLFAATTVPADSDPAPRAVQSECPWDCDATVTNIPAVAEVSLSAVGALAVVCGLLDEEEYGVS